MKRRQFKLALFLLLGAVVAFPLGIAVDVIFPIPSPYHPHYRDSIGLWLIGEGPDQQISDEPDDDPTGYVFFVCRRFPVEMSPIFPTRMYENRLLHITLYRPTEQELWGKQCDPWRPMIAEYLSVNGYDSWYSKACCCRTCVGTARFGLRCRPTDSSVWLFFMESGQDHTGSLYGKSGSIENVTGAVQCARTTSAELPAATSPPVVPNAAGDGKMWRRMLS